MHKFIISFFGLIFITTTATFCMEKESTADCKTALAQFCFENYPYPFTFKPLNKIQLLANYKHTQQTKFHAQWDQQFVQCLKHNPNLEQLFKENLKYVNDQYSTIATRHEPFLKRCAASRYGRVAVGCIGQYARNVFLEAGQWDEVEQQLLYKKQEFDAMSSTAR